MCHWPNKIIIEFLNEVRIHPEVWNVKSDLYKNKEAKRDGWASIAKKFGVSSDEAYKKFKSLRTYAKNEEKRNKNVNKPVKWFAYDAISFILAEDADSGQDGLNNTDEKAVNSHIRRNIEQADAFASEAAGSSYSHRTQRGILDDTVEQNEYAPFGEHIAYKLSRYDSYTRANAEMKIMQILFDCDMQMLRNQNEELVPVTVLSETQSDE